MRNNNDHYTDSNQYCRIYEKLPENPDTTKALIALPGLMYRTHLSTGNLSEIVNDHDAAYIHFDYPKTEFSMDKVTEQLSDYIEHAPYDEIVIMGISFGEIVFRHLMDRLSDQAKTKIKHHISLNGVSTAKDLSPQYKIMLTACNIKSSVLNKLMGVFGVINRKIGGKLTNSQVYNNAMEDRIKNTLGDEEKEYIARQQKRHQKSAALGFTPGYIDRARDILHEKNDIQIDVPSDIIYSSNDEFFAKPQQTAGHVAASIDNAYEIHEIKDGGHIALVEFPKKYEPTVTAILDKIWNQDVIQNNE